MESAPFRVQRHGRALSGDGQLLDDDGVGTDVLLTGDVFYNKAMASRFTAFLKRCAAAGTHVLVGDPGRAFAPREGFATVATMRVPVAASLESTDTKDVSILTVSPPD